MNGIFETLPKLLRSASENPDAARAFVFTAWRRIAGKAVSENAVPVEFDKNRLTVAVESENWRLELSDLAPQLLFKLNAALGKAFTVRFIDLYVDPNKVLLERSSGSQKALPELPELPFDVMSAAEAIDDIELRRSFLGAARSSLALKRNYGR